MRSGKQTAVALLAGVILCFLCGRAQAADLIVSSSVTISADTTFDSVVVLNGGTLTANGELTIGGKMRIDQGGVVRHSRYPTNSGAGLRLNVADSLIIDGTIYLTGYGLRGANGSGSTFGSRGEAYDATGTSVVAGSSNDAGASYGGVAQGTSNAPYGVLENPAHFGSGGSGCNNGGNGGGLATISAAVVLLNGSIQANGTQGGACAYGGGAGGGSGGGVRIACGKLTGPGSIYARGGNGVNQSPTAGGGGRIAIFYADISGFDPSHIYARGGTTRSGSAGTIYLKDSAETYGHVIIDNDNVNASPTTPFKTALTDFSQLTVKEWGELNVVSSDVSSFTVSDPVLIGSSGRLTLESGVTMSVTNPTGIDIEINSAGRLTLDSLSALQAENIHVTGALSRLYSYVHLDLSGPGDQLLVEADGGIANWGTLRLQVLDGSTLNGGYFWNRDLLELNDENVVITTGSRFYEDSLLTADDAVTSLTVESGGLLAHSQYPYNSGSGLRLSVLDTMRIDGSINVTGSGLRGAGTSGSQFGDRGEAYDASGTDVVAGSTGDAGGSYGGVAQGTSNAPYGVLENPTHLGSGGSGCNNGGNGGGLVMLSATVLVLSGSIQADGTQGGFCAYGGGAGGGSGGGVRIACSQITGTGSIYARGGAAGGTTYPTAGGGGRIAVFYADISGFDPSHIYARGGTTRPGSAGTIYLKDSADVSGTIIVDNGGVASTVTTPHLTGLPDSESITVQNQGRYNVGPDYAQLGGVTKLQPAGQLIVGAPLEISGGEFHANGGTASIGDTLYLTGGALLGTSSLTATVVNDGLVSPGASEGRLTINGNYIQQMNGTLHVEIGGHDQGTNYDHLVVNGIASLAGVISTSFTHGHEPINGDRFDFLNFDSLAGSFDAYTGFSDNMAVSNFDTSLAILIGDNLVSNSIAESHIILSPAGNIPYIVELRDIANQPISGSMNCWLDFGEASGLTPCSSEPFWPLVYPDDTSDGNGRVRFSVNAGGCTPESVMVMTSHGMITKIPIKSVDVNGGLLVTMEDFTLDDPCNDLNNDGLTDFTDWDLFLQYLGQTCIDVPSNYCKLKIHTVPDPEIIYQGDTIQVCAAVSNSLDEEILLDSVVFLAANWGIARSWTEFNRKVSIPVGPEDSTTVCAEFVVPNDGHGCFQVHIYPSFSINSADGILAKSLSATDTLVYGLRDEPDGQWAFIETSSGQVLNTFRLDPITNQAEDSTMRLLGLTPLQTLGLSYAERVSYLNLASSDLVGQAASMWETGFPEYSGTFEDTILQQLSAYLSILTSFVAEANDAKSMGFPLTLACDCNPNGCGPNGALNRIPDFNFGDCCDAHDLDYGGCTGRDRATADWSMFVCISSKGHPGLALIYFGAVRAAGGSFYCDDPPPPPPPGKGRQLNIDPKTRRPGDSDGDGIPDGSDPCPNTSPGCRAMAAAFGGCPPGPSYGCTGYKSEAATDTISSFFIPIGPEGGDSLRLEVLDFMPTDWSYSISDSIFISTPDTIFGYISHSEFIACDDTGRVVFRAYDLSGNFVGEAEASAFALGSRGDYNADNSINVADITGMVGFLFRGGLQPFPIYSIDNNHDNSINIADVTFLVDFLFRGGDDPRDCPLEKVPAPKLLNEFVLNTSYHDGVTTVFMNAPVDLWGLQLELTGEGKAEPINTLSDSLDMVWGRQDTVVSVGLLDLDGRHGIKSGKQAVVSIPGRYSISFAIGSDLSHQTLVANVSTSDDPTLPTEFSLSQNYPNPFNPSTTIQFSLPGASDVRLEVLNILGQVVATLVNDQQEAGYHTIDWNGKDGGGNSVASGIYFYRITAGDYQESKKMLLLK